MKPRLGDGQMVTFSGLGNSAFTVGAAAMTAAGAVAASTRRKGRASKAETFLA